MSRLPVRTSARHERVLFVHGFGGQTGGAMERALARAADRRGVELRTLRWPAGDMRALVAGRAAGTVAEVVRSQNKVRAVLAATSGTLDAAAKAWRNALAQTTSAAQKLAELLDGYRDRDEPLGIVGFSLGCRVTLDALGAMEAAPPCLRSVVFAAAAAPANAFRALPASCLNGRIATFNVHSRRDEVLRRLYPLMHTREELAGTAALGLDGVDDVEVEVGHTGYPGLASILLDHALTERDGR